MFMRKLYTLILMLVIGLASEAQPPHYNHLPAAGVVNVFPFNVNAATGKRVQWVIGAGTFSLPAPAPAGNNITNLWFYANNAGNATYTNLTIRMATVSTSTFLTTGAFYTGPMTTVRAQNTTIVPSGANTWVSIPLTTPYLYDPTMNLIIEVSQCGYTGTGFSLNQTIVGAAPNLRRQFSDATSLCGAVVQVGLGDNRVASIGISVTPSIPCPTPPAQPTGLILTAVSQTQINGSFTAAAPPSTNYLVVRYPSGAVPVNPVNGANYLVGGALGTGTVISTSSSTTFTTTGLTPATTYDFYVYSHNTGACGTTYLTSSPLFGSRATLPCSGPPGITCPANITVNNAPDQCGANVTYPPATSSGNPAPVITYSVPSGSFFPVGSTTVTATATSVCGTSTCTFTITVVDNQLPVFTSPGLFPERLYYKFDGSGTSVPNLATAPPPGTATATLIGLTQGSTGKCGTALVGTGTANQSMNTNWATNMSGNWTISFWLGPNQVDNNPSYLFGDVTATGGATGAFRCFYGGAALTNNVLLRGGNADILISGVNPAATFITVVHNGANTVVYKNGASPQTYAVTFASAGAGPFRVGGYSTVASINGNMDEFGMYSRALTPAEVLSLFNTCPVNVNNCPANITVNNAPGTCGAVVTYTTPVGVDNCPGVVTMQTAGLPSGSTFPVGTTTNNFRATDASGNIANCTFNVTVVDNEQPNFTTCPANQIRNTDAGQCYATYTPPQPTFTDNCAVTRLTWAMTGATTATSPATLINYVPSTQFGLTGTTGVGVTTITYTATDAAGNTRTCSFTVTVNDASIPVITAPLTNQFVCVGSNGAFTIGANAGAGNPLTYQWQKWNNSTSAWENIPGATNATLPLNAVTFSMNTNSYRVILTGRCSVVTSNFATLYVNRLPSVILAASRIPILLPTETVNLVVTADPSGGTYQWFKNGSATPIPGVTGAAYNGLTVDDIGTYTVRYTDLNGCVSVSNAITVSGATSDNLYVYPNPNFGQFSIRFFNQPGESATITIFDAKGARVYQRQMVTTTAYTKLDVDLGPTSSSGVYIVEVLNSAGKVMGAKKVIVRHQ